MPTLFPILLDYQFFAPFILRLTLGIVFLSAALRKLWYKKDEKRADFEKMQLNSGWLLLAVGWLELVASLLIFLGIFTQAAAAFLALVSAVYLYKQLRKETSIGDASYALLLLGVSLAMVILPPGPFSIDMPL